MSYVGDLRRLLRGRDFRRLFGTRLAAQLADGWFQVALAGLFFFSPEQQATVEGVAGAFAVLLLPYSLVGPFAGVLLDRWRRRQVLVWANVLRAGLVVVVAGLVVADVPAPVLYAAVLATLSVNRFFLAALSAALPHVVRREELVLANAVTPTSGTLAFVVGLGTGFLARTLLGSDPAVLPLAAAAYLFSASVAARMHPDLLGPDEEDGRGELRAQLRQVARGLVEGARHVWQRRPAADALGAMAAMRFAYGITVIAVILLLRNSLNDPAQPDAGLADLSIVFVASGAGFFAAAVATPAATRVAGTGGTIVAALLGAGVVLCAYVVWLTLVGVVVGAFLVGLLSQALKICVDTIVQRTIEDEYRGRVFSFYDVLFNVAFVSAAAVAALVVPSDGAAGWVYGAVAATYLVAGVAYRRAARRCPPPEGPLLAAA